MTTLLLDLTFDVKRLSLNKNFLKIRASWSHDSHQEPASKQTTRPKLPGNKLVAYKPPVYQAMAKQIVRSKRMLQTSQ